jgi:hypothetical protein
MIGPRGNPTLKNFVILYIKRREGREREIRTRREESENRKEGGAARFGGPETSFP